MMRIKLITILTFVVLLFPSCYNDSKNATVRINLGNMPIAKQVEKKSLIDKVFFFFLKDAFAQVPFGVIRVHLAAYKGDSLIAKESIDAGEITSNVVEFSVPIGENITIVVLGERYEGSEPVFNDIMYYGKTINPINLNSGDLNNVSISMSLITDILSITVTTMNEMDHLITWNKVIGASRYSLEFEPQLDPYGEIYNDEANSFLHVGGVATASTSYRIRIIFSITDKWSNYINYNF